MGTIKQYDKRSGITYVYESISYWDKEKKQPRSKRTLIGRLDPDTGKVVPTDGRGKRRNKRTIEKTIPDHQMERLLFGATYLLDQIGIVTGVSEDLKTCFPNTYKQILSIAYFLIMEDQTPLCRFKKWAMLHKHPFGKDISPRQRTELFQSITEEAKMQFFRLQEKRHAEEDYWVYNCTSISSYSEMIKQINKGGNKDDENLPQLNLAILFGQDSGMPIYYRNLYKNTPDVQTICELIRELDVLGYKIANLVMGWRGYNSDNNRVMEKECVHFLCSVPIENISVKSFIREIGATKDHSEHYNSNLGLYIFSKTRTSNVEQPRPHRDDSSREERASYLHLYFNPKKQSEARMIFDRKLEKLKEELLSGKRVSEHEGDYQKYFIINETPESGISISYKQNAIDAACAYDGFFALISNEVKDSVTAFNLYSMCDIVEEAFCNCKDRLIQGENSSPLDSCLEGELFVEFVAFVYLSYIKKKLEENVLLSRYKIYELLDELDVIECYTESGKNAIPGKVLKNQEQIYRDLDIKPLMATPKPKK